MRRQITKATIDIFINDYISKPGKPGKFVTDHGTSFTNNSWRNTLKEHNIKHTLTSSEYGRKNKKRNFKKIKNNAGGPQTHSLV